MNGPICHRCGRRLEKIDLSHGATVIGGTLPVMYGGVICGACRKVECRVCKSARGHVDAPCSWCGGAVSPAFEHLLGGGGIVPISWDRAPSSPSRRAPAKPLKKSTSLLIALVVLAIIAAVSVPNLGRAQLRSRYIRTIQSLKNIEAAIASVGAQTGDAADPLREVSDLNGLAALLRARGITDIPRVDAWGRPFVFERKGDTYTIASYGGNGKKDYEDPFVEPALPMSKGGDLVFSNGFLVHAPEEFRGGEGGRGSFGR